MNKHIGKLPRSCALSSDKQSSHCLPSLHNDCQIPPHCHLLCLTFLSCDESLIFLERYQCCRGLGLTSIQTHEDEIHTRHMSHNNSMAKLDCQPLTMTFEVAFEVKKAALNGDLEPFKIHSLSTFWSKSLPFCIWIRHLRHST